MLEYSERRLEASAGSKLCDPWFDLLVHRTKSKRSTQPRRRKAHERQLQQFRPASKKDFKGW